MALIQCAECGGKVSSTAAACPHCGAPVALSLPKRPAEEPTVEPIQPPEERPDYF